MSKKQRLAPPVWLTDLEDMQPRQRRVLEPFAFPWPNIKTRFPPLYPFVVFSLSVLTKFDDATMRVVIEFLLDYYRIPESDRLAAGVPLLE